MSKKVTDIVAYLGPVGFIVAFLAGDRIASRFHLNQALVLYICTILLRVAYAIADFIPLFGWLICLAINLLTLVLSIFWIIGIVSAITDRERALPVIGSIRLL